MILIAYTYLHFFHCIGGVMVRALASSAVDCGLEPRSGQAKDCEISICCFCAKYLALRRNSKDWLLRILDDVSSGLKWLSSDWCFNKLAPYKSNLVCWPSTKRTSSSSHQIITCCRHDLALKWLSWHKTTITHSIVFSNLWHWIHFYSLN